MLQHTEHVETSSIEISALPLTTTDTVDAEAELSAHDLDAELKELAATIQAGVAQRERTRKSFLKANLSFYAAVFIGCLVWLGVLLHNMSAPHVLAPGLLAMLMPLSTPIVVIGGLWWLTRDRSTIRERNAAKRIVEIDDIRAAGPIIDTLGWPHKGGLRPALWQALGRLLPRMTEDEARALGKERHLMLATWVQAWDVPVNRKLFVDAESQTLVAILHTMAQIGQSSFQVHQTPIPVNVHLLPTLKKWAEGRGSGQDPAVQETAVACREAIQEKMALARTGAQLLRASAPTPAGSDTLLRPTEGVQQTDPTELLRPGDSEEQDFPNA
ncbi:MAG: hypothetical protein JWL77_6733 [Chthonomonadaceae bacterium]|nr:hypothetical protein [Chthonomonadaceae bacterium]